MRRSLRKRSRRGVQSVQLVFIVPLLFAATIAVFEFGVIMQVRQSVTSAAMEGARMAAKGGDLTAVTAAVNQILAVNSILITANTSDANVVLELPGHQPMTLTQFSAVLTGPALGTNPAEVRVTVALSYVPRGGSSAWMGGLLPDFLSAFGYPLSGQTFNSSALAVQE